MNKNKLKEIIENHKHWLNQDCKGWEEMRADLCGADLSYANLSYANLSYANLNDTNLNYANLSGADLSNANLSNAVLYNADLYDANLSYAKLREADLRCANLCGANLCGANLSWANLSYADFYEANLCESILINAHLYQSDFYKTNLYNADFYEADIYKANFCKAKNIPFIPMICPEEGSFIGFKKAGGYIIKLEICGDARRSSATNRKCRCDKAKVISITNLDGSESGLNEIPSNYNFEFIYRVGEIIEEPEFCDDRFNECASGIHFFISRQEAVYY